MKKLMVLGLFLAVSCFAGVTDPLPDSSFWAAVLGFIGSVKGMSVLALAAAATQLAMVFFRTSYGNVAGKFKISIVLGLSVVLTLIGALASGANFFGALVSGPVLAAIQVFVYELYKQFSAPVQPLRVVE